MRPLRTPAPAQRRCTATSFTTIPEGPRLRLQRPCAPPWEPASPGAGAAGHSASARDHRGFSGWLQKRLPVRIAPKIRAWSQGRCPTRAPQSSAGVRPSSSRPGSGLRGPPETAPPDAGRRVPAAPHSIRAGLTGGGAGHLPIIIFRLLAIFLSLPLPVIFEIRSRAYFLSKAFLAPGEVSGTR